MLSLIQKSGPSSEAPNLRLKMISDNLLEKNGQSPERFVTDVGSKTGKANSNHYWARWSYKRQKGSQRHLQLSWFYHCFFHMKTAWGCGAVMFLQYFLWFGNQSVGMFVMAATETPCHDCRESERHRRTAMKLYSEGIQPRLWKSETKNRSSVAQGCKISYGVHVPNSRMMSVTPSLSLSFSLRVLMRMHSLKNDDSIISICVWQEEL